MLFNSQIFILLFLPIALFGWYLFNAKKQYQLAQVFLVGMSLWFYGYFNPKYLYLILLSMGVNYLLSGWMQKSQTKLSSRFLLLLGIGFNLGGLFYFKYYDFFLKNINWMFQSDFTLKRILLPLGISFFTFQQLSYLVDRYRGNAPHYPLLSYMNFVTFFPQLIAGPIVLHGELIWQFEDKSLRSFERDSFTRGLVLFILGLGKKVLLADVLAQVANYGFDKVYYLDTLSVVVVVLCYALQLYFDFSGYSDMAMGMGWMFRIELPVNFDSPYLATSVQEFWQKWHITLNRFFISYAYIPLGGSRKGSVRTFFNTVVVFVLSGLWHGANWTYVLWGLLNGVVVALNQVGIGKWKNRKIGWFTTFGFFNLTLIIFRSNSLSLAWVMLKRLFTPAFPGFLLEAATALKPSELYLLEKATEGGFLTNGSYWYVGILLIYMAFCMRLLWCKNAREIAKKPNLSNVLCTGCILLFVWSLISLSQVSTFLYFNF